MVLLGSLTLVTTSCSSKTASAPDLSSITLMTLPPTDFTIGSTLQFKALGTYFGGSTADITSKVTWTSSNTNIVIISSMGIATGVAPGSANITAALSGLISLPITLPVLPFAPLGMINSTTTTTSQTPAMTLVAISEIQLLSS
jgi:hypothetical protein